MKATMTSILAFILLALTPPAFSATQEGDQTMTQMRDRMHQMDRMREEARKTSDPAKHRELMHRHMKEMREGMHGMRGMMGETGMGMGMGMGMGKDGMGMRGTMGGERRMMDKKEAMSPEMMQRRMEHMQDRMDMMQMMMERMMEHQEERMRMMER